MRSGNGEGKPNEQGFAAREPATDAVLEALEEGYGVLADITNQWEGRHTIEGQKLLCKMRDAIASATGISGELVQDNATNPLKGKGASQGKPSSEMVAISYAITLLETERDWEKCLQYLRAVEDRLAAFSDEQKGKP